MYSSYALHVSSNQCFQQRSEGQHLPSRVRDLVCHAVIAYLFIICITCFKISCTATAVRFTCTSNIQLLNDPECSSSLLFRKYARDVQSNLMNSIGPL